MLTIHLKIVEPTISLGAGGTDLAIYKNSTSSNILGVSLKNRKTERHITT